MCDRGDVPLAIVGWHVIVGDLVEWEPVRVHYGWLRSE